MISQTLTVPIGESLTVFRRGPGGVPTAIAARVVFRRHCKGVVACEVEVDEGLDATVSAELAGQRLLFDGKHGGGCDGPKPAA